MPATKKSAERLLSKCKIVKITDGDFKGRHGIRLRKNNEMVERQLEDDEDQTAPRREPYPMLGVRIEEKSDERGYIEVEIPEEHVKYLEE